MAEMLFSPTIAWWLQTKTEAGNPLATGSPFVYSSRWPIREFHDNMRVDTNPTEEPITSGLHSTIKYLVENRTSLLNFDWLNDLGVKTAVSDF
jgi:hypothetical protein